MEKNETLITVPAELVVKSGGLAFDIGGSVMKIVYRTKDDFDKACAEKDKHATSTMRLVSFSRQEVDSAVQFIKEKAYITRTPGQDTTVYATGAGGQFFKDKFNEELNVKAQIIGEVGCFGFAMIYLLKNLAFREIVHPFVEPDMKKLVDSITADCDIIVQLVRSGGEYMTVPGYTQQEVTTEKLIGGMIDDYRPTADPDKPLIDSDSKAFPLALVFGGSAFAMAKLQADGWYNTMHMQGRGGRSCLGMANVFLGCKTYEEFLALAEKGNSENVDYCDRDMMADMMAGGEGSNPPDMIAGGEGLGPQEAADPHKSQQNVTGGQPEEQDAYRLATMDDTAFNGALYNLGKMVGKTFADFKREDLAHALLRYVCSDLAQMVDQTLRQDINDDVRHVFFLGSFPSNKLTRDLLTEELILRSCMSATFTAKRRPYNFYFVKHGAHIGCLGALINTTEKFAPAAE